MPWRIMHNKDKTGLVILANDRKIATVEGELQHIVVGAFLAAMEPREPLTHSELYALTVSHWVDGEES